MAYNHQNKQHPKYSAITDLGNQWLVLGRSGVRQFLMHMVTLWHDTGQQREYLSLVEGGEMDQVKLCLGLC